MLGFPDYKMVFFPMLICTNPSEFSTTQGKRNVFHVYFYLLCKLYFILIPMFRQIILAVIILFLGNYTLLGQKTDIPLNNFIVNQESKELYYQKIFEIQKDSVASIKKKIERITSTHRHWQCGV